MAQLSMQEADSGSCSPIHAKFRLPELGANSSIAVAAQSSVQAAKPASSLGE